MTSPLAPLGLPQLPEHGRTLGHSHLQLLQGESVSACGQPLTVREIANGPDTDYIVVCGCGWQSLPLVSLPGVLRCEACDTLAEGKRRASAWDREGIEAGLRLGNLVYHAIHREYAVKGEK